MNAAGIPELGRMQPTREEALEEALERLLKDLGRFQ